MGVPANEVVRGQSWHHQARLTGWRADP